MNSRKPSFSGLISGLTCSLFLLSITQITLAQTTTPLNQLYTNALCGISIKYPSNWIKEDLNMKSEVGGFSMTTLAEIKPNTVDGGKSVVELVASAISIYPDKSIEGIAGFERDYIQAGPGAKIEQSTRMDINGHPAYKIVYTESLSKSSDVLKIMETYIPSGDTEYTIRFTATDKDHYDKYLSTVEDMIRSVKIDGKKC